MKKGGLDFSCLTRLYDRAVGVFAELFDTRLLTPMTTALMFYTVLFTQRKFPLRWMFFVLFGMVLVLIVSFTARTPGLQRVRWHRGMTALFFLQHGWMALSGLFFEDWLPEAVALLVAYPFVFSVFSAREDRSTFRAILRACVFAVLPFLVWSYATVPLTFGYPGYYGVFYNANGLAMCCIVMSVSALLLAQTAVQERARARAVFYGAMAVLSGATLALTLSRSALLSYIGALVIVVPAMLLRTARRPRRVLALTAVCVLALSAMGVYVTQLKFRQVAQDDWETALYNYEHYDAPIIVDPPEERKMTLDDLTSDRYGIWKMALQNLTLTGHESSVVEEWAAWDGGARRFNAHNSFIAIAYQNGWPAGLFMLCYVALSTYRAARYYWLHRHKSPLYMAPLAFSVVFIMESLFEAVYAPFSVVGCAYLLVQGVLLRADLSDDGAEVAE